MCGGGRISGQCRRSTGHQEALVAENCVTRDTDLDPKGTCLKERTAGVYSNTPGVLGSQASAPFCLENTLDWFIAMRLVGSPKPAGTY